MSRLAKISLPDSTVMQSPNSSIKISLTLTSTRCHSNIIFTLTKYIVSQIFWHLLFIFSKIMKGFSMDLRNIQDLEISVGVLGAGINAGGLPCGAAWAVITIYAIS